MCFHSDSLSFSTMLSVEEAIDKEKTKLMQSIRNDEKIPMKLSESSKNNNTNSGYRYYLGMESMKQDNFFKTKYLKAVDSDQQTNSAVAKSPVVKGPRVSMIKTFFETMSQTSAIEAPKPQKSVPTYLGNKVPKPKTCFKNSSLIVAAPKFHNTGKASPVSEVRKMYAAMSEKKNIPKTVTFESPKIEKKSSKFHRRFVLKNSPSFDYAGISRSPIRPVYQTRKIFSPAKSSPREFYLNNQ